MDEKLLIFAREFIHNHYIGVLACVFEGSPSCGAVWYSCFDNKICFKSRTNSNHSRAFLENPRACFAIYDHNASYPDTHKTGVQIMGHVYQVTEQEEMLFVLDSYQKQFGEDIAKKNNLEELLDSQTASTFYVFVPEKIKLVAKELGVHMDKYEEFSLA